MAYLGNDLSTIVKSGKVAYKFLATSGQTSFTGNDANGVALELTTDSFVNVFLNGVRLIKTDDYTVSYNTLTLVSGATLNDELIIVRDIDNSVYTSYTKTEADAVVNNAITNLKGGVGTALDTLNELAAALGNDANYAATVTTALGTKANTSDVNTALALKANTSDVNTALALKANQSTTYTKTEVDTALSAKANTSSLGTLATISPTGTPSSSTFLRGDNSWQAINVADNYAQSYTTTNSSYSGGAWYDVSGISLNITPTSTSNKVLIMISLQGTASDASPATFRLLRNGSEIFGSGGTNGGFTTWVMQSYIRTAIWGSTFIIVDSPSTTSSTNYKVQGYAAGTWYINQNYGAEAGAGRVTNSSIVALEIKQ